MDYIQKVVWFYIPIVNLMIWWYIGARNHVSICLSTISSNSINSINIDSNNVECNNDKTNIINSYSNDKCTLSYSDEYEVDYDVVDTKGNTTTILHNTTTATTTTTIVQLLLLLLILIQQIQRI